MLLQFRRALRKEKQYLTPLQRCVFITVGLVFIASAVVLLMGAIRSRHYGLLWLLIPLIPLVGWGNAMLWAAIQSSPDYRPKN
jgi:hypothetical protein